MRDIVWIGRRDYVPRENTSHRWNNGFAAIEKFAILLIVNSQLCHVHQRMLRARRSIGDITRLEVCVSHIVETGTVFKVNKKTDVLLGSRITKSTAIAT